MNIKIDYVIPPFVVIIDVYYATENNYGNFKNKFNCLLERMEKEGVDQIIFRNWSAIEIDKLEEIYRYTKKRRFKVSLIMEYTQDYKTLDRFICNIYKIYQDNFNDEFDIVREYFMRSGIRVCRLLDLKHMPKKEMKNVINHFVNKDIDEKFEKTILRINNMEMDIELENIMSNCKFLREDIVFVI